MRQLREHPVRTLGYLLGTAFVLFMLSGIPRYRDAKDWGWDLFIGDIFWFGFVITAFLFLLGAAYLVTRRVRASRTAL
jgi:hypothetical protein